MIKLLEIQKQLIPQVIELMERRYIILRQISLSQPVGRRTLSNLLGLSERIVRTETEFLKGQELITVEVSGMKITEKGKDLLEDLREVMDSVMGISNLEMKIKNSLGIKDVVVAPGNYDENTTLIKDIANYAADYFLDNLKEDDVVAITGGTTMREFSEAVKTAKTYKDVTVVPARGSFGQDVDTQSNSIASSLSKTLKSHLELLTIPDELVEEAKEPLMRIPGIKNAIEAIKRTSVLVFSIGRADVMAERRNLSDESKKILKDSNAVGEAFGYYFNRNGEIILKLSTVGIDLDLYNKINRNILVFAGSQKVEAFMAISEINKNFVLVTDENTAREILKYIENN